MRKYDRIQKIGSMRIYWKNGKVVGFQLPKCPECGEEYSDRNEHQKYFCELYQNRKEREK